MDFQATEEALIFALLDPDPYSESGYRSADPIESGSETLLVHTVVQKYK
jgi:hypothetical protein